MTQRSTRTILAATLVVSLVWLPSRKLNAAEAKPEKVHLEVAIAAYGPLYLPLLVAHEAGYFHGFEGQRTRPEEILRQLADSRGESGLRFEAVPGAR